MLNVPEIPPMDKLMKTAVIIVCSYMAIVLVACSYCQFERDNNRMIDEWSISLIKKGFTTEGDVLALFGAPTYIKDTAEVSIYVYQDCHHSVPDAAVKALPKTPDRQCKMLLIAIDNTFGLVEKYGVR